MILPGYLLVLRVILIGLKELYSRTESICPGRVMRTADLRIPAGTLKRILWMCWNILEHLRIVMLTAGSAFFTNGYMGTISLHSAGLIVLEIQMSPGMVLSMDPRFFAPDSRTDPSTTSFSFSRIFLPESQSARFSGGGSPEWGFYRDPLLPESG